MKKLLLAFLFSLPLLAGSLQLQSGSIEAHTEMAMDSTIDPLNKSLFAEITMDGSNIETMAGKFWIDLNLFISDNKDRDTNMHESLESKKFILTTYTITSVKKTAEADMYDIHGKLDFHGVQKDLSAKAKITLEKDLVSFDATSVINMPDFGVEMPCMVFMCVRDQVDLVVQAKFTK